MFIDEVEIYVKGGDGGSGATTFHREKYRPMGGPDGGDGGKGGSLIIRASESVNTLIEYTRRRHFRAERGGNGSGNNSRGADGKDLILQVPVGTQVRDEEGGLMADLSGSGREAVVAKGGRWGRGNASFATPARRAPDFSEKGEPGEERWIRLELKLLADVGVVGLPNVGKSTLISHISAAKPKIADYPFTTLEPVLGVVSVEEGKSFVISDLPGLIAGAHEGKGLGLRFLRHVERTKVLLHLVDVSPAAEQPPSEALQGIVDELVAYSPSLMSRPQVLAANKLDIADPARLEEARVAAAVRQWDFFPVSAVTGEGLQPLLYRLNELVETARVVSDTEVPEETTLYSFEPEQSRGFRVVEEDGEFRVTGERVERLVKGVDLNSAQALAYVQARLKRMGVEEELLRQGTKEGDTVIIGDLVFDFFPEL
ncbi:MAG: GTPase ObgE [Candidatus Solincola sediminis]|uniref:GTPase Obg n=1 Tax=Candidatus Solincola sediminis TaxID=1797199 RepID=A0A1F2WS62_9ACTN|nr:MAG: GTPase ObgE [Candidatus Solincola sediminis]OFW60928.1 MAG: GTPase ObgE [Candidatus Solincola sediminis]